MPVTDSVPSLQDYVSVLLARKRYVIGVTVVVIGAALFHSLRQTTIYESSAKVLVRPESLSPTQPSTAGGLVNMETEKAIATSQEVTERAKAQVKKLGLPLGSVSVEAPLNTETLLVRAFSNVPNVAQATAQAFADSYLEFRRSEILQDLSSARDPIERQIVSVTKQLATTQQKLLHVKSESARVALDTQLNSLAAQLIVLNQRRDELILPQDVRVGELLQRALPSLPSNPSHLKTALLALLVGLALGTGVALFRDRFDERLRGRDELELYSGAPVLAFIPAISSGNGLPIALAQPTSAGAEAYQTLRLRLLRSAVQRGFKSLVVTSSVAGEGKTSTVANLGVVLAQGGKRVVLLSADLRRPGLQAFFSTEGKSGLTDVLLGKRKMLEVLFATEVEHLWVLHPGPRVVQPSPIELLASEAMRDLLAELRGVVDFVLVDTPPLLAASDATALAPWTDGVLFVADPRRAQTPALEQARLELQLIGAPIIGVVVNNHDPRWFRTYSSQYKYSRRDSEQGTSQASGMLQAPQVGSGNGS